MRLALCLFISLAACAEFPALDGTLPPSAAHAPYPALIPLGPVVTQASQTGRVVITDDLPPRLAALRARAAALRGPVIAPGTRARMDSARMDTARMDSGIR